MSKNIEIVERINFYIKDRHGGNKSSLARDWGTSYPQLAAILNGTRGVPASMIRTAADNGYNIQWLLTGRGEPFLPNDGGQKPNGKPIESTNRDELLASKDKIIELLEGKVEKLEVELRRKKAVGGTTKKNQKVLLYPVEAS